MDVSNELRLIQSASGLSSFTVEYKGRLLYSKYAPERSVLSLIARTKILPGTLVLVNSPVLFYGLPELLKNLPEDCHVLALEADSVLFDFSRDAYLKCREAHPEIDFSLLDFLCPASDLQKIDSLIRAMSESGKLRRCLSLDFSAGAKLNEAVYRLVENAATEIIGTFWKNRITLVKMGRLFSKNIFRNLRNMGRGLLIDELVKSVDKPILVCGAGESLDATFSPANGDFLDAVKACRFFILAVDAALTTLLDRGIPVDAAVGVEPQFAIQKAYIGAAGCGIPFFADLCSRPEIPGIMGGRTIWYASEFCSAGFLDRLRECKIIPSFFPPMGSVGLVAAYIALLLRTDSSVPVFVTGLDFSYSAGLTHASGCPASKAQLFLSGRKNPAGNYGAAFSDSSIKFTGKNGKEMFTSPSMKNYAAVFSNFFSSAENLFDAGVSGLNLSIPRANVRDMMRSAEKKSTGGKFNLIVEKFSSDATKSADGFCDAEIEVLEKLRDLLSLGEKSEHREKDKTLSEQIRAILEKREYLFLHFPDGYKLSMEENFLKRVRAEIDFFLKEMKMGEK